MTTTTNVMTTIKRVSQAVAWPSAVLMRSRRFSGCSVPKAQVRQNVGVIKTSNVFDAGLIWVQESVVWMHAMVFMLGSAYTLKSEEHVRVDVFYRTMGERRRAWVDLVGILIFLLPLCLFLAWKSFDFVTQSWSLKEASRESGGLPYPFIPILKSVLLLMPLTVALQGVSLFLSSLRTLRGK